jgi:hypothetical protein
MSFTGEQRGIGKGGVERTVSKVFRVRTEEELRDSEDVVVVKVGAGCQTRTPLVLREWVVDEPIELVVLSADLVAGWKRMLRECTVDELAVLLVVVVVLSADMARAGWERV